MRSNILLLLAAISATAAPILTLAGHTEAASVCCAGVGFAIVLYIVDNLEYFFPTKPRGKSQPTSTDKI